MIGRTSSWLYSNLGPAAYEAAALSIRRMQGLSVHYKKSQSSASEPARKISISETENPIKSFKENNHPTIYPPAEMSHRKNSTAMRKEKVTSEKKIASRAD